MTSRGRVLGLALSISACSESSSEGDGDTVADETGSDDGTIELPEPLVCEDVDAEPGPSPLELECAEPLAPPTACAAGSACMNVTLAWQRCAPAELGFRATRWTLDGDLIYTGDRAIRIHADGTAEEPVRGEFLEWMAAGPGLALNWGEQISLHPEGSAAPAICVSQPNPLGCSEWWISSNGNALLGLVSTQHVPFDGDTWCEFHGLLRFDALGQQTLLDASSGLLPTQLLASGIVAVVQAPPYGLAMLDPDTGALRWQVQQESLSAYTFATGADVLFGWTLDRELLRFADGVETDRVAVDGPVNFELIVAPLGDACVALDPQGAAPSLARAFVSTPEGLAQVGTWEADPGLWPPGTRAVALAANGEGELFSLAELDDTVVASLVGVDGTIAWQAELGVGSVSPGQARFVDDDQLVVSIWGSGRVLGIAIER